MKKVQKILDYFKKFLTLSGNYSFSFIQPNQSKIMEDEINIINKVKCNYIQVYSNADAIPFELKIPMNIGLFMGTPEEITYAEAIFRRVVKFMKSGGFTEFLKTLWQGVGKFGMYDEYIEKRIVPPIDSVLKYSYLPKIEFTKNGDGDEYLLHYEIGESCDKFHLYCRFSESPIQGYRQVTVSENDAKMNSMIYYPIHTPIDYWTHLIICEIINHVGAHASWQFLSKIKSMHEIKLRMRNDHKEVAKRQAKEAKSVKRKENKSKKSKRK